MPVWGARLSSRRGIRLLRSLRSPSAFSRMGMFLALSALATPLVAVIARMIYSIVAAQMEQLQKATWKTYLDMSKEILERETRRTDLALVYGAQFREDYRGSTPE